MTSTLTDTLIATVYGHDSSASTDFAALPDVDGLDGAATRALTTASTAINQPNYGMGWKLVDVTSIVQELVSEGSWAPGSPMTFLMVGGTVASSPSFASIEDFSAPGTNHARLSIDFNNAALLGTHRWGQVADQFEATTGVFDRPLFRFQVRNVKGTTINLGTVIFQLTGVVGITNGDTANFRLNNGTADLGSCTASISGATGTITCTPGIAIATDAVRHLTLLGDVFNLSTGDTMTISLATTDVVVPEGPVGRQLPLPTAVTHSWGARTPLLAYSDYAASGIRPLKFSKLDNTTWDPAAVAVAGPFDSLGVSTGPWPLLWKKALLAPGLAKQSVFFQEDDGDKSALWTSIWNGTAWDDGAGGGTGDAKELSYIGVDPGLIWTRKQHWDAAYEQVSGELVAVGGINTDESILWWTYDGAGWPDYVLENLSNQAQGTPNVFDWVHVSPMPRTNRIAFIGIGNDGSVAKAHSAVHAAIWDGENNTWTPSGQIILSWPVSHTQNYHTTDAADIKFTLGGQNHGDAVAVWGNKQYVYANVWSESTGWRGNQLVANLGTNKTVRWLRLEANPKSDDMVVAIGHQDGTGTSGILSTVPYDGTSRTWGARVQHATDLYGDVTKNRPFDVMWDPLSSANSVMLVYSVTAPVGGNNLLYARSSTGGLTFDSPVGISTHQAHWVQVERDPWPHNKLRLAIQTDELRSWSWDSFSWADETPSAISTATEYGIDHDTQPFALAESPLWGEPASGTTPVRLAGFTAAPYDASVVLEWETASELDNLGFHLYRGASADGPWARLTASLIPGLGSSPEGRAYRYVDSGLENGTTYFYRLEDVDRKGVATAHGPVSATPVAGESVPGEPPPPPGPAPLPGGAWVSHGNPAEVALNVLERTEEGVTFELLTGGFYAQEQADGTSRLHVPGFFSRIEPGLPSVPTKRLWTEATVGRGVRLLSVTPGAARGVHRPAPGDRRGADRGRGGRRDLPGGLPPGARGEPRPRPLPRRAGAGPGHRLPGRGQDGPRRALAPAGRRGAVA